MMLMLAVILCFSAAKFREFTWPVTQLYFLWAWTWWTEQCMVTLIDLFVFRCEAWKKAYHLLTASTDRAMTVSRKSHVWQPAAFGIYVHNPGFHSWCFVMAALPSKLWQSCEPLSLHEMQMTEYV